MRNGNDKLLIMRKGETLSDDDFSYTTSGNDITITSYIGSDTDVKIIDKFRDMYVLVRPIKIVTLTINPTPNDATVVLTAAGYTQSNNSITVQEETIITYSVSKEGYIPQSGTITLRSDTTMSIILAEINGSVDATGYEYTLDGKILSLTKYIGSGGDIDTPEIIIEEES